MLKDLKRDIRTCDVLGIPVSCMDLDFTVRLLETAMEETT